MVPGKVVNLFVYGTLMRGFPRHALLKDLVRFAGRGRARARLYDLGSYPGAVPDEFGVVYGEVYELLQPEATLSVLDKVEGFSPHASEKSLFRRDLASIALDKGSSVDCWVYFYNGSCEGAQAIPGGDFARIAARRG